MTKHNNQTTTINTSKVGIYLLFAVVTAMIGYHIHDSIFWSIMDFLFPIFTWIKWLIFHDVNLSIIKETFSFFLQ